MKTQIIVIEPSLLIQKGLRCLLSDSEFVVNHLFFDYYSFSIYAAKLTPDIILVNPIVLNFYKQAPVRSFFANYPTTALIALLYNYIDAESIKEYNACIDIYDNSSQIFAKLKQGLEEMNGITPVIEYYLSERETEILVSVAQGATNKDIANMYNISTHTVISHRKNITRKIGIKTVAGLTVYAMLKGLIKN